MYNRFKIAIDIQNASNISGVARELVKVIDDARAANPTGSAREDSAVYLVVDKLFDLVGRDTDYSRKYNNCATLAEAYKEPQL